jgi:hypothetical protein
MASFTADDRIFALEYAVSNLLAQHISPDALQTLAAHHRERAALLGGAENESIVAFPGAYCSAGAYEAMARLVGMAIDSAKDCSSEANAVRLPEGQ